MLYFDDEGNANINQMWINIRCFNISMLSSMQWLLIGIIVAVVVILFLLWRFQDDLFRKSHLYSHFLMRINKH